MDDLAVKLHKDPVEAHHLMRASLALYGKRFAELCAEERKAALEEADRSLAVERCVLTSREAVGIIVPPSSLDHTIFDVRHRYDSEADFLRDLADNGLDAAGLAVALERELKVEAVLEKIAAQVAPVANEEVRRWYDTHPDKFAIAETRSVRHILITINDELPGNEREMALARIEGVRYQLDGTSEQFAVQANRHSECPTALEGGLLGRVPRGKLYGPLDARLFAMRVGEVSEIIESEAGFHILYCEKIHPPMIVSYEEAAPKIRDAMMKKRREKAQTLWLAALLRAGKAGA